MRWLELFQTKQYVDLVSCSHLHRWLCCCTLCTIRWRSDEYYRLLTNSCDVLRFVLFFNRNYPFFFVFILDLVFFYFITLCVDWSHSTELKLILSEGYYHKIIPWYKDLMHRLILIQMVQQLIWPWHWASLVPQTMSVCHITRKVRHIALIIQAVSYVPEEIGLHLREFIMFCWLSFWTCDSFDLSYLYVFLCFGWAVCWGGPLSVGCFQSCHVWLQ